MGRSTLWTAIERGARNHPAAVALRGADGSCSFLDLHESLLEAAHSFGVIGTERAVVAVAVDRSVASARLLLAIAAVATAVPLDTSLASDVVGSVIARTRPDAHAGAWPDAWPAAPAAAGRRNEIAAPPSPEDLAFVLATSGSSGAPKLVKVSHANLAVSAEIAATWHGIKAGDSGAVFSGVTHILGIRAVCDALFVGSSMELLSLDAATTLIDRAPSAAGRAYLIGSPASLDAAASAAQRRRSVLAGHRFVRSGAAAVTPAARRRIEIALGVPLVAGYAMSEVAKIATHDVPPRVDKGATVGRPTLELEVRDADGRALATGEIGEVTVRGPGVSPGYIDPAPDDAARFGADGWFSTGDLGSLDADGYLTLHGRLDDVINKGGVKVWPAAVEAALDAHPDVAGCIVCGVEHPTLGAEVGVVVARRSDADVGTVTPTVLAEWLGARVDVASVPTVWRIVDALPRLSTNKADRVSARSLLSERDAVARVLPGIARGDAPAVRETAEDAPADAWALDAVRSVWSTVLDGVLAPDGTRFDDVEFLAAGGNSMLAVELAIRLGAVAGTEVAPSIALSLPTVRDQARWLSSTTDAMDALVTSLIEPRASTGASTETSTGPATGSAPIEVIVLPGKDGITMAAADVWRALDARFPAANLRVRGIDLPARLGRPIVDLDEITELVEQSIDRLGVAAPILVGWSFGGFVAVELAARPRTTWQPRALVLVDTPLRTEPVRSHASVGGRLGRAVAHVARVVRVARGARGMERVRVMAMMVRPAVAYRPATWDGVDRDDTSPFARHEKVAHEQRMLSARRRPPKRPDPAVPVVLLAASNSVRAAQDVALGWRAVIPQLAVRVLRANHASIVGPDAAAMAVLLHDELRRVAAPDAG